MKNCTKPDQMREVKKITFQVRKILKDNPSASLPPELVEPWKILNEIESESHEQLYALMMDLQQRGQVIREKLPPKLAAMPDDQLRDSLKWAMAVASWDYRDGRLLHMLLHARPVPMEIQRVLADIIAQKRLQKRLSNSRLNGFMRALVSQMMWIDQQFNALARKLCDSLGDDLEMTPTETIEAINSQQNFTKHLVCSYTGLSNDGLEKLRKEAENYLRIFD